MVQLTTRDSVTLEADHYGNNEGAGNAISGVSIDQITPGQEQEFSLGQVGNISIEGYSEMRFQISGPEPGTVGYNRVRFAESSHESLPGPELDVTYTRGGGEFVVASGGVGIGTSSPEEALDVRGDMIIGDGSRH